MRKLTGYIGAMIIVFALAGSILAGYALNINGTSTVINEYEKVTDVSGLYAHSDEKTYIEYNPASNYVNYTATPTPVNNPVGVTTYKSIKPVNYTDAKDGDITNVHVQSSNGLTFVKYKGENSSRQQGMPTAYLGVCFICDYFFIELAGGTAYLNDYYHGLHLISQDGYEISTLNHNGEIWVYYNGETHTWPYPSKMITYYTDSDYDYYQRPGDVTNFYLNNPNDLVAVVNYNNLAGITIGKTAIFDTNQIITLPFFDNSFSILDNGLYYGNLGAQPTYGYLYPKTVTTTRGLGIDYTESSRVNNYLMESQNSSITTTTGTLTLSDVGDNNYFYINSQGKKQMINAYVLYESIRNLDGSIIIPVPKPSITIGTPALLPNGQGIYDSNNPIWNYDGFHNVKLSTVLQSFNIPQGATSIKITTDSDTVYNFNNTEFNINLDKNLTYFSYLPNLIKDNGILPSLNSETGKKDYLVYDVASNMCTVYTYDGVARYSGNTDEIGIFYYEGNTTKATYTRVSSSGSASTHLTDITDRPTPFITLEITQSTGGVMKYADITKGYSIRSDNFGPVRWNNTYENGDIKVLFRANDTSGTYSNTLTVANNNISINYTNNRFSVSLNSGSPVDIGTWRNIVLDMDLINGKLYAIPVRTFNSFTNVVMDNTSILIGDLVGAAPTNNIVWGVTTNSFLFNVYSTDVFMNTYGVVMVNPTLDITHFFTDLNQFYRLKMYNFAIYGDSMTINGETLAVTDGKVTYDDMTLELKDFNVTYADGMVTIGDNHGIIELGEITTTNISMDGNWYFITDLERGYTAQKTIYDWDWGTFIFDNTQFCVFYLGIMAAALIVARKYCNLSIIDYMVLVASIVIALGVQVVA